MEPRLPAHPLTRAEPGPGDRARREACAGLYVHVPFCATRCSYCDFSSGAVSPAALDRYVRALAIECGLRADAARGVRFHSVFFGGGTPSALPPRHFRAVWTRLRACFDIAPDAEVTLEANPESVTDARLDTWREAGVNRLSMGAQSFVPEELATLRRVHAVERPAAAAHLARAHGFDRLSLDLMFGFPGNSAATLARSLDAALSLGVEHLSAYCFIPEPVTTLGDATLGGALRVPDSEEQADFYMQITETCADRGLACYETSNFCRADAEARHNLVYWLRRPYLGLGPSAHSLLGGERFANHYAMARWAGDLEAGALPEADRESCDQAAIASEIVLLALRLGRGLDPRDYAAADRAAALSRYGAALEAAAGAGRLERNAWGWRVPAHARFVADEAIAWVLARERKPEPRRASFDSAAHPFIMMGSCPSLPSPAI